MGNTIDPRIAMGVQVPQIEGPIDLQRGALSVQQLINATQLQKQQQASAEIARQQQQIDLENQQQAQKDTLAFNKAYRDAGGDWDQTIKNATTAGVSGTFLTQKQIARADLIAKTAATTKVQRENDETKITALAKDADTLLKTDPQDRPSLYNSMVNAHVLNGNGAYKITDFPATVPSEAQLQDIVSHSKAVQDIHAEAAKLAETNAKLPGEQAEAQAKRLATAAQTMNGALNQIAWTARRNYLAKSDPEMAQQIPENYSPEAAEQVKQMGISPEKQAVVPVEKMELASFMQNPPKGYKATPAEFMRYQKSIAPILNMNLGMNAGGGLNDTTKDMLAERFYQTGQLPPTGRGPAGIAQQREIMNRASQLHPGGGNLAENSAEFAANKASLTNVQKNFDAVSAFENTAGKNLDIFLNQAKKAVDTGLPVLNLPARFVAGKLGGTDQAAFETARTTALTEIAKVLSSANAGSGVLSDSARGEVEGLIKGDATLGQIMSAANILKQDMANRHQSYSDQLGEIKKRMGAQGGGGSNFKVPAGAPAAPQEDGHKLKANGNVIAVSKGGSWVAPQ